MELLMFLTVDELSQTTLIALICFLSTILVTRWLLVAIFVFCFLVFVADVYNLTKHPVLQTFVQKTRTCRTIMTTHRTLIDCYTYLDRPAQKKHYEDVKKKIQRIILTSRVRRCTHYEVVKKRWKVGGMTVKSKLLLNHWFFENYITGNDDNVTVWIAFSIFAISKKNLFNNVCFVTFEFL